MEEINKEKLLYEDKVAYAILAENPSAMGHIQVFPKQKVSSLEELPDDVVQQLFFIASFAASAVFEGLGAHGTNIIIQDGKILNNGQLHIDIIPRKTIVLPPPVGATIIPRPAEHAASMSLCWSFLNAINPEPLRNGSACLGIFISSPTI